MGNSQMSRIFFPTLRLSTVNSGTNKVRSYSCKGRHCLAEPSYTWNVCGVLIHPISNVGHVFKREFSCSVAVKVVHLSFLPRRAVNKTSLLFSLQRITVSCSKNIIQE